MEYLITTIDEIGQPFERAFTYLDAVALIDHTKRVRPAIFPYATDADADE